MAVGAARSPKATGSAAAKFHCDERGSFHAASAKTAWERTMDFLRKHLKK